MSFWVKYALRLPAQGQIRVQARPPPDNGDITGRLLDDGRPLPGVKLRYRPWKLIRYTPLPPGSRTKRGQKLSRRQRRKLRAAGKAKHVGPHHWPRLRSANLLKVARVNYGVEPFPGEGWRSVRARLWQMLRTPGTFMGPGAPAHVVLH